MTTTETSEKNEALLSYSQQTKLDLCENIPKNKCCRRALYCGMVLYRIPGEAVFETSVRRKLEKEFAADERFMVTAADELFVCDNCRRCFLRGVFLACGTLSSPVSSHYQLDLLLPEESDCDYIMDILSMFENTPIKTVRAGKYVLCFRENEAISDFLNIIGAQNAAYEFVNTKIKREFDNNAQRVTNCDVANILRTVDAAKLQLESIARLRETGRFDDLPAQLRETAELRCTYPDCNLSELAELHDPPITKSGVNHRLSKIIKAARDMD